MRRKITPLDLKAGRRALADSLTGNKEDLEKLPAPKILRLMRAINTILSYDRRKYNYLKKR